MLRRAKLIWTGWYFRWKRIPEALTTEAGLRSATNAKSACQCPYIPIRRPYEFLCQKDGEDPNMR